MVEAVDFIKSTPTGKLDLEASRTVLDRLCTVVKNREDHAILIGLRRARSILSTTDVWYLAEGLGRYGECFHRKTAILVSEDGSVSQAKFFELTAQNRSLFVRVFVEFEKAMYWLGTVEEIEGPQSNIA